MSETITLRKLTITKADLKWFSEIMDRMVLLNKTLDLAYKPELTETELTFYSAIGKELMIHNAALSGLIPPDFFELIKRHYPNANNINDINQLSLFND
jgi:hypothetical protein